MIYNRIAIWWWESDWLFCCEFWRTVDGGLARYTTVI
jgi:hypothetical protein